MSKYQKDSLGNRMKGYENVSKTKLMENMPIIIRLDGCGFSKYTKSMKKPFDNDLIDVFHKVCKYLAENIIGAKYVYHQSDEISILLRNDDTIYTQAWFKNDLMKLVSVSASMATAKFNEEMAKKQAEKGQEMKLAHFDSRAFVVPESEIHNYFLWRQQDCMRNAISMVAQSLFTQKQLNNKSSVQMLKMMKELKGVDYENEIEHHKRFGASFERETVFVKNSLQDGQESVERHYWQVNLEMPNLKEERDVFYKYKK